MKARVKATGHIVEVEWRYLTNLNGFDSVRYVDQKTGISYFEGDLDFYIKGKFTENCLNGIKQDQDIVHEPDYWTRLEHQAAIAAMQSYVSNNVYLRGIREMCKEPQEMRDLIADLSILLATTFVQKLKDKEERK